MNGFEPASMLDRMGGEVDEAGNAVRLALGSTMYRTTPQGGIQVSAWRWLPGEPEQQMGCEQNDSARLRSGARQVQIELG